ncbi:MAG: DNA cytosine methyltransferase, partial [Prochlorotrichaceae cyanobacterium]
MTYYPTVIDLFCGCGGFSTGLLDAGMKVVSGFDIDRRAIEVYNYNHQYRGAKGFQKDLSQLSGKDILSLSNLDSVDMIVGGVPCQAFSIVGKREGINDPRGKLIFDFIRLLDELRPAAFILENVPNLKKVSKGEIFELLISEFQNLGYIVKYDVLSAADYGVAQNRKRIFIVGVRGCEIKKFPPSATHCEPDSLLVRLNNISPYVTCRDVLENLPDVDMPQAELFWNHEPTIHNETVLQELQVLRPGTRSKKYFYDRLHPDRLSYTLRAGSGNFTPLRPIHYKYNRVISVRESARLQGFSDDFIWEDSIPRLQQYRQVGNAVCPPVAKALGILICETVGWERNPEIFKGNLSSRATPLKKPRSVKQKERAALIRGASMG